MSLIFTPARRARERRSKTERNEDYDRLQFVKILEDGKVTFGEAVVVLAILTKAGERKYHYSFTPGEREFVDGLRKKYGRVSKRKE